MDNENYDGDDVRLCPFCEATFSTDSDKCLAAAVDKVAALESALHERDTQCHMFAAQILELEAELAAERERAERAEAENAHWRTEREAMVSRELYEAAVKEQRERAEEAEADCLGVYNDGQTAMKELDAALARVREVEEKEKENESE